LSNKELRKRERPFVLPLVEGEEDAVERASYDAAYKGVTDALTLYLWRKPAFYLTRWAARAGLSPKDVARSAADIRLAGSRLANSLPPSDGALYTMVVAKVPASIAASVTGYLLEGAGRRSQQ
jgi:hypothetical protein